LVAALGDEDAVALGDEDAVSLGDGDAVALGDADAVALGDADALALGDGDAFDIAFLTTTPLFQTSFFLTLMQVYFWPLNVEVFPSFEHVEPVFTAA
jgi:hypothetical protein